MAELWGDYDFTETRKMSAKDERIDAIRVTEEFFRDGQLVRRNVKETDGTGRTLTEHVDNDAADRQADRMVQAMGIVGGVSPKDDHAAKVAMVEHNEEKFEIKRQLVIKVWEVLWVYYPDCPNGNKVMVFRIGMRYTPQSFYDEANLPSRQKRINPHFGRGDSPFARFEPTEQGWRAAIRFAETTE